MDKIVPELGIARTSGPLRVIRAPSIRDAAKERK